MFSPDGDRRSDRIDVRYTVESPRARCSSSTASGASSARASSRRAHCAGSGMIGGQALPAGRYRVRSPGRRPRRERVAARRRRRRANPVHRARSDPPACHRGWLRSRPGSTDARRVPEAWEPERDSDGSASPGSGRRRRRGATSSPSRPVATTRAASSSSWRRRDPPPLDRRRARNREPARGGRNRGRLAYHSQTAEKEVRGSSTVEFEPTEPPEAKPRPPKVVDEAPWPTFGHRQPADAPVALQAPAPVQAALAPARALVRGVPARGGLREGVRGAS